MTFFILGSMGMYIPMLILIDVLFDSMEESGVIKVTYYTIWLRIILAIVFSVTVVGGIVQIRGGF